MFGEVHGCGTQGYKKPYVYLQGHFNVHEKMELQRKQNGMLSGMPQGT